MTVNYDTLLRDRDAARYLQVHPDTLRQWRVRRCSPPYLKIGGTVLYRMADLLTFAQARQVQASRMPHTRDGIPPGTTFAKKTPKAPAVTDAPDASSPKEN